MFKVVKTYGHDRGLSCAFRQWRAADSHCSQLHGYAISVELTFVGPLDERNWVIDFGSFGPIKDWLGIVFDHTVLVAADDPMLPAFKALHETGVIRLVELQDGVGCERFAELIASYVNRWLESLEHTAKLESVKVMEHAGNAAMWVAE